MGSSPKKNEPAAKPVHVRRTRQYLAVLAVLNELDEFRTVQEIHAMLLKRGESVALATVYRLINAMVEQNEVDVLRSSAGDAAYRRCGSALHHHHLTCRSCGQVVEVSGPDVEAWADRVASEHGFTGVGHSLEIIGTCGRCAARA
jgi:Fur family ferric uptake transcriptional regulator